MHYSGIPGNISLNINERVLLFKQEMVRNILNLPIKVLILFA